MLCCVQEVSELREAKQLLIQQKLEMQGRVESQQAVLEKEKQAHQATRGSIQQQKQEMKVERDKMEGQLVACPLCAPVRACVHARARRSDPCPPWRRCPGGGAEGEGGAGEAP